MHPFDSFWKALSAYAACKASVSKGTALNSFPNTTPPPMLPTVESSYFSYARHNFYVRNPNGIW